MKVKFFIKKKGESPFPIYLALREREDTELIFTGQRIAIKDWNVSERFPKKQNSDVAKELDKVKLAVNKAIRKLEFEERPVTPFTVKLTFQEIEKDKQVEQASAQAELKADLITVTKLCDRWLEEETFRYQASTQKAVKESIDQFKAFLKWAGHANIERRELNKSIISGYEKYLLEKKKLNNNTHGKRIKHLRWFLKYIDYPTDGIKIRSMKKRIIALTLDELQKLEAVDVSYSVEHTKSRDAFLLGCYSGLRISDLRRLNPLNTRDGFITLKTQKNNKEVQIPIIKAAARILEKYGYHAPKISEQALNECIKKVCKKAGITQKIVIDDVKANVSISTTKPKYKHISSHIAGKTFITLAPQLYGLTPAEIAAIVGKDLKTLINSYFADQGAEARRKILEAENRAEMKIVS